MNKLVKILLFITGSIFFGSCHFLGPVDSNIQQENIKASKEDFIGIWTLDSFSYEYLNDFKKDSIQIEFFADSSFRMNNSLKLFNREIDNKSIKGDWDIREFNNEKSIKLKVENSVEMSIFKKGDQFQLWYFLSDPDTGERIRFIR